MNAFAGPEMNKFAENLEYSSETSHDNDYWRRWGSIWLTWFMMFILVLQFSMYSTTLAVYIPDIDKEASDSFAPWAIAAFGFGQTIGCPLFGWVSNKMKNNRKPMIIGMIFMIIGNVGYCMVELFPYGRRWLIFIFRVITGFGGGIAGVIRAYCATAAKKEEYTKSVTGATAALALAIMAGPGAQAMFSPIGYPGFTIASLPIHMYNAPGWVSVAAAIICVYFLYKLLIEEYPGIQSRYKDDFAIMPKYDSIAAWTLIVCWFAIYLTLTSFVMIGKSYTMVMFHWSFSEAVVDNGIIMGVFASVSLTVFVIYAYYGERLDGRFLIFSGMTMMISFWLITFPWPALPELSDEAAAGPSSSFSSISKNASAPPVNDHAIDVGCNSLKYSWCTDGYGMTREPIGLYLSTFFLLASGFPLANCALSALFSKVLGPRRQGTMQGIIIAGGAAARTSGPLFINYTFNWFGPRVSWALSAGILVISIVLALFFYKKLVALNTSPNLKAGQRFKYKTGVVIKF